MNFLLSALNILNFKNVLSFNLNKWPNILNMSENLVVKNDGIFYKFPNFFFCIASILLIICLLVYIAYFTILERKVMAAMQRRRGPEIVGVFGLGQAFADGLKLLNKESNITKNSNKFLFIISPVLAFTLGLTTWALIPLNSSGAFINTEINILIILALSSLSVYAIIFAGWACNNKYALLGCIRAASQMISYEIIFSFVIMPPMAIYGSASLLELGNHATVLMFIICIPISVIFFIVILAETNRSPFDLPEAESELVAGYNVEYSSLMFSLFFLAEYASMGAMCALFVILYGGAWNLFGLTKSKLFFDFSSLNQKIYDVVIDNNLYNFVVKKVDILKLDYPFQGKYPHIEKSTEFFLIDSDIQYFREHSIFDETSLSFFVPIISENNKDVNILLINDLSSYFADNNQFSTNLLKNFGFFVAENQNPGIYFIWIGNVYFETFIFAIKLVLLNFLMIWIRATLPRYRFDHLLILCWKYFMPLTLGFMVFSIGLQIFVTKIFI